MPSRRLLPALFLAALAAPASLAAPGEAVAEQAARLLREPAPAVVAPLADAVAASRVLVAAAPPEELAALLDARPELVPGVHRTFAAALAAEPGLGEHLAATARASSRRLADGEAGDEGARLDLFLARLLVDPSRFVDEPSFRSQVLSFLGASLDAGVAAVTRRRLLERLGSLRGVGFAELEAVGVAWGVVPRPSAARRLAASLPLRPEPPLGPIAASIYSPGSGLFTAADLEPLLRAVRRLDADRVLVLAVDEALAAELAPLASELGLRLVPTLGIPYSPWPRDPLTFARTADGRPALLLRPNPQRGREEDALLGRTLAQGLPDDLDAAWGGLWWRAAPLPFHNGQVLVTPEAAWSSVHGLEPRILELLGLPRVPVTGFAGSDGARYLAAAHRAAAESASLYGRPLRFVHPLPEVDDPDRAAALGRLGGGAGLDLDSLVTLLPTADGVVALVGDLAAGAALVVATPTAELAAFAGELGLAAAGSGVQAALVAAQSSPRAADLEVFLDAVAGELARHGRVERLPLLWVPRELEAVATAGDAGFLVGWHNVVLERRGDVHRAEGFASSLPSGDAVAVAAFARAGYRLDLLPPLVESVRRGGGYRCASQHLRDDRDR